jgi:RNA polymerase sigma-70 factor, ECF subfamily
MRYTLAVGDGQLMAGVRTQDAACFEALYDRYHRLVYGLALKMLGDVRSAEDVTQAIFLKIWSVPESFHGGNLPAWLARVTRNRALDAIRSSTKVEGELAEPLSSEDALEDGVIATMEGARVRDAMMRIPQEQRELLEWGFFGGLTHSEMARRTGLPLGTIKTRIRAGLRRLRGIMEGGDAS